MPIYPSTTTDGCAFLIADSGARAVIAEDAVQVAKLAPLAARHPGLHVVAIEGRAADAIPGADGGQQMPTLAGLRQAGVAWNAANPGELDRRAGEVAPGDCFTIIYT